MKQKKATIFIIIFVLASVVLFSIEEFEEINTIVKIILAFMSGLVAFWNAKN